MAEFELAKPRIHPAEFYGGNEDDSADGPVQGGYPSLETMTGNLASLRLIGGGQCRRAACC